MAVVFKSLSFVDTQLSQRSVNLMPEEVMLLGKTAELISGKTQNAHLLTATDIQLVITGVCTGC